MKIGFSFSKKTEVRQNIGVQIRDLDSEPKKDVILDIANGKVTLENPEVDTGPLVIPCTNLLKLKRKRKGDDDDDEAKRKKDELAAKLETMSAEDREAALALIQESTGNNEIGDGEVQPIMMQSKFHGLRVDGGTDKQMLLREEAILPEAAKDQFETVPVEHFGMALMRGMGYNPKKDTNKPILLARREGMAGLGAVGLLPGENAKKNDVKGKAPPSPSPAQPATSSSGPPRILLGFAQKSESVPAAVSFPDASTTQPSSSPTAPSPSSTQDHSQRTLGDDDKGGHAVTSRHATSWVTRGLLVKIARKGEWFGCKAVALKEDKGRVRLKVRKGDGPSEVLEDVSDKYLETVVGRDTKKVRVVEGQMLGEEGKVILREVEMNRVTVKIRGREERFKLEEVCEYI
eukprot:GEMP01035871.1.p1 GENE.GEMP01035871.1~~GEMP01035871.1.p1  ORF type:complete len:403 (-),score=100.84 GEMP01035871.1:749-1957(-)